MSPRVARALFVVAIVLGVWLLSDWYFSDTQRIRRRLSEIQRLVAKSPAESDLAAFAAARRLSELFAEPFEARAEPAGYSTADRTQVASSVHQYRSRSTTLVMEILDEQIFLDAEGVGANSFFTARFLTDLGDLATSEQYDCKLHWIKAEGEWLIDHAQVTGVHALP